MGFNPLKLPSILVGLIGKVLGIAKRLNLGGLLNDLILDAEKMRTMTGPEKLQYVLNELEQNHNVAKFLADLKAKAAKAGVDANAIYNAAYDKLKAQVDAQVAALNALGLLFPHSTQPVSAASTAMLGPATVNKLPTT